MNIREPLKEATTIVVGVPMALAAAAGAAIVLMLNLFGIRVLERLDRR